MCDHLLPVERPQELNYVQLAPGRREGPAEPVVPPWSLLVMLLLGGLAVVVPVNSQGVSLASVLIREVSSVITFLPAVRVRMLARVAIAVPPCLLPVLTLLWCHWPAARREHRAATISGLAVGAAMGVAVLAAVIGIRGRNFLPIIFTASVATVLLAGIALVLLRRGGMYIGVGAVLVAAHVVAMCTIIVILLIEGGNFSWLGVIAMVSAGAWSGVLLILAWHRSSAPRAT